jgi:hypothetical protein
VPAQLDSGARVSLERKTWINKVVPGHAIPVVSSFFSTFAARLAEGGARFLPVFSKSFIKHLFHPLARANKHMLVDGSTAMVVFRAV